MRPTVLRMLLLLAVLTPPGAALAFAPMASACPFCGSRTGEQVKAGIFNEDFGYNLSLTLLPFPILLGIVALIHFGLPRGRPTGPDRHAHNRGLT